MQCAPSTILYFFVSGMGNIDDQHRNPNMNNKGHLVGQLTSVHHHNRSNIECWISLVIVIAFTITVIANLFVFTRMMQNIKYQPFIFMTPLPRRYMWQA